MLGTIWFSYAICFAHRASVGVVIPALRSEFAIIKMQSGSLMSFFFPVIAGWVLDVYKDYNYPFASFVTCALLCFLASCTIGKLIH
jgi:hypothetical protein